MRCCATIFIRTMKDDRCSESKSIWSFTPWISVHLNCWRCRWRIVSSETEKEKREVGKKNRLVKIIQRCDVQRRVLTPPSPPSPPSPPPLHCVMFCNVYWHTHNTTHGNRICIVVLLYKLLQMPSWFPHPTHLPIHCVIVVDKRNPFLNNIHRMHICCALVAAYIPMIIVDYTAHGRHTHLVIVGNGTRLLHSAVFCHHQFSRIKSARRTKPFCANWYRMSKRAMGTLQQWQPTENIWRKKNCMRKRAGRPQFTQQRSSPEPL